VCSRAANFDVELKTCPPLNLLTRHIYGLLRALVLCVPPEDDGTGRAVPSALADAIVEARSRALGMTADDVADHAYPYLESYVRNIAWRHVRG